MATFHVSAGRAYLVAAMEDGVEFTPEEAARIVERIDAIEDELKDWNYGKSIVGDDDNAANRSAGEEVGDA